MDSLNKSDLNILNRLDLYEFIEKFYTFLARPKAFYLNGDLAVFKKIIDEMDSINLPNIPNVENIDSALNVLKKSGDISLKEIFNVVKILNYFLLLKKHSAIKAEFNLFKLLDNIKIPESLFVIINAFNEKGEIKAGFDSNLDGIKENLNNIESNIKNELNYLINNEKLNEFLVDKQIHFLYNTQTLLLKAGFSSAIKGSTIERSPAGFYFVLPDSINSLYQRQKDLIDNLELALNKIAKEFSANFRKHILFLNFINKEFDKFDLLQARVNFAKSYNLEFILPHRKNNNLVLSEFCHPNLKNPKPINIEFNKNLLMITGVNAGGKTMLLKSILSSCFLAKHLLPFKINPHKSKIPHFKNIKAIIQDPQNSKNDISTFAGRMIEFKENLNIDNLILGIDEIELGTDADEAASLYKILLEELLRKEAKIIITTHHKRLAALMANNENVEMCAAIYDIKSARASFEFMQGSIGKSYAFETALKYGIPPNLINLAKEHYGVDKERLNELIERSSKLEIELKNKSKAYDKKIQNLESKKIEYDNLIENLKKEFKLKEFKLESTYNEALNILKQEAKNLNEVHKNITNANKFLKQNTIKPNIVESKKFNINDRVKYINQRGTILSINNKTCLVELDSGMRLKVEKSNLKKVSDNEAKAIKKANETSIAVSLNTKAKVSIDLHGLRAEEAIEKVDKFLNDSLIAGFNEVLIYHGIGSGVLSRVVKEFLNEHPKVISFKDAPANMGGMGAKIVCL